MQPAIIQSLELPNGTTGKRLLFALQEAADFKSQEQVDFELFGLDRIDLRSRSLFLAQPSMHDGREQTAVIIKLRQPLENTFDNRVNNWYSFRVAELSLNAPLPIKEGEFYEKVQLVSIEGLPAFMVKPLAQGLKWYANRVRDILRRR